MTNNAAGIDDIHGSLRYILARYGLQSFRYALANELDTSRHSAPVVVNATSCYADKTIREFVTV